MNRHVCSACRLAKCFANGMQPELIRSSFSKKNQIIKTSNILTTISQQDQIQLVKKMPSLFFSIEVVFFLFSYQYQINQY